MTDGYGNYTFTDSVMFSRVMRDEAVCRAVIESIFGWEVQRIEYKNTEQTLDGVIGTASVRLDAYVEEHREGEGCLRIYDIEMQAQKEPRIAQRFREYQGRMDERHPKRGGRGECDERRGGVHGGRDAGVHGGRREMPESYIVFICLSDPLGEGIPVYTIDRIVRERPNCPFDCKAHWLALNAEAYEQLDAGPLRDMLQYVATGVGGGKAVSLLSSSVETANNDRKWVSGMRTLEEYYEDRIYQTHLDSLAEGIAQGKAEGIAQGKAEGKAEGIAQGIAALMANMGWTEQQAREALGL